MQISEIDKYNVKSKIDDVLNTGRDLGKNEIQYFCPFCSHHKPKLQVNLETGKWNCWVCHSKGTRIHTLLKRLNVDSSIIEYVKKIYGDSTYSHSHPTTEEHAELLLPAEYKPILDSQDIIEYRVAYNYLKRRGLTDGDILKHKIGYCDGGVYKGRIIIPSYSTDGKLNYFIARTIYSEAFLTYKNPPVSKNIIALESFINWKMPVNLCEGMFDAIAIKRNAIPLLGKTLSKALINKILIERPDVNIILDDDALNDALEAYNYLVSNGINCNLVSLNGKDPSKLGFKNVTQQIQQNTYSTFEDMIKLKLSL
jgi:DNA primase